MSTAVRVWIVQYDRWQPRHWHDVPTHARVVAPLDERTWPADEAELIVAGFNQEMLASGENRWAVARPVVVQYEGDYVHGQVF